MRKLVTVLRNIAVAAVSGALLFAALVQWGSGHWEWVEVAGNFRLPVALVALFGTALFVLGLSLGRVVVGLAVVVWLAWPFSAYVIPDSVRGGAANDNRDGRGEDPGWMFSLVSLEGVEDVAGLLEEVFTWRDDLVVATDVTREVYIDFFPQMRAAGYMAQHIAPAEDGTGVWAFTRHEVLRDQSQSLTRELGRPAVDWTLDLGGGRPIRLLFARVPWPWNGERLDERRLQLETILDQAGRELAEKPALMLAGDLAALPGSHWFSRVLKGANVADTATGRGWHPTWRVFPGWEGGGTHFGLPSRMILADIDLEGGVRELFWWERAREATIRQEIRWRRQERSEGVVVLQSADG